MPRFQCWPLQSVACAPTRGRKGPPFSLPHPMPPSLSSCGMRTDRLLMAPRSSDGHAFQFLGAMSRRWQLVGSRAQRYCTLLVHALRFMWLSMKLIVKLFTVAFFSAWMWYLAVHRFLRLRHSEMTMWCCLQNGQTALMLAVFSGHDAVVKTLLDKGADTSDTDKVRFPLIQKNSHR